MTSLLRLPFSRRCRSALSTFAPVRQIVPQTTTLRPPQNLSPSNHPTNPTPQPFQPLPGASRCWAAPPCCRASPIVCMRSCRPWCKKMPTLLCAVSVVGIPYPSAATEQERVLNDPSPHFVFSKTGTSGTRTRVTVVLVVTEGEPDQAALFADRHKIQYHVLGSCGLAVEDVEAFEVALTDDGKVSASFSFDEIDTSKLSGLIITGQRGYTVETVDSVDEVYRTGLLWEGGVGGGEEEDIGKCSSPIDKRSFECVRSFGGRRGGCVWLLRTRLCAKLARLARR